MQLPLVATIRNQKFILTMTPFELLFSRSVAVALLKQQKLGDFLGEHNWQLSLDSAQVDFGKGRVYPVQIIGTEADHNSTWLWAWANEVSPIPQRLLEDSNKLRNKGIAEDIEELRHPQLELDLACGHFIAMIASTVCNADAYYRGPYDGGAVFFTIYETPLAHLPRAEPVELISVISSCITQFPVEQRLMVTSLFESQEYSLQESDGQITATSPRGQVVAVNFDGAARISGMETTATAQPKPEQKKPWWKIGG